MWKSYNSKLILECTYVLWAISGHLYLRAKTRSGREWFSTNNWVQVKATFLQTNGSLCLYVHAAAAAAKSLQSCPTLCDPIDGSPPGSAVPGIHQARTLEWVVISFSNAWKWKVKVKSLSRVWLFETPWTAAYQAPPSMGFSRQEYWSGVPLPSPLYVHRAFLFVHSVYTSLHLLIDRSPTLFPLWWP